MRRRLESRLENGSLRLSPRNSYVLGSFVPLVSDLDLTILLRGPIGDDTSQKIQSDLDDLTRIFPFIGESNVYFEQALDFLLDFMNPFELERDPELKSLAFKGPERLDLKTLAAVFLFRMLDADLLSLTARPRYRVKKWLSHSGMVTRVLGKRYERDFLSSDPNVSILTELVLELLELKDPLRSEVAEQIARSFELKLAGKPAWHFDYPPLMWILTPHVLVYSREPQAIPAAPPELARFFIGQIEWEIWGIGTQYLLTKRKPAFFDHLLRLEKLLPVILPDTRYAADRERLRMGLDRVIAWMEPQLEMPAAERRSDEAALSAP